MYVTFSSIPIVYESPNPAFYKFKLNAHISRIMGTINYEPGHSFIAIDKYLLHHTSKNTSQDLVIYCNFKERIYVLQMINLKINPTKNIHIKINSFKVAHYSHTTHYFKISINIFKIA